MNRFLYDYWKHGLNRKHNIDDPWHRDGIITIFGPLAFSATVYSVSLSVEEVKNYAIAVSIGLLALSQVRPVLNYMEHAKKSNGQNQNEEKLEDLVEDGSA